MNKTELGFSARELVAIEIGGLSPGLKFEFAEFLRGKSYKTVFYTGAPPDGGYIGLFPKDKAKVIKDWLRHKGVPRKIHLIKTKAA